MEDSNKTKSSKQITSTNNKMTALFVAITAILTVCAYQPILFDWFVGDDFVHLIWLKQAMSNPELIVRNFYHNWLDVQTTSFYRPLISVFMAFDYSIWNVNGLGFHLTNLFFHLVATVSIFFIASGIFKDAKALSTSQSSNDLDSSLYGLMAAIVFGLYPLHCEAVSWITGRVDVFVAAFMSLSLLTYRNYRQTKKKFWLTLVVIFMILALMSKEMAITLPFIFFGYSLFLEKSQVSESFLKKLIECGRAILPFILILILYFVVRYFSLGTILGGYDNSFLPSISIRHYVETWIHGLRMFLIPLNRDIIPSSHPATYAWFAMLFGAFILFTYNFLTNPVARQINKFNLVFIFFAFLPVYKLFAISNDLQGSRLAHIASIAFALLISTAFLFDSKQTKSLKNIVSVSIALIYIGLLYFGMATNNSAWQKAGIESNSIRGGLKKIYSSMDNDPQVLLTNLPDNINGAYVARNALDGMTKSPQFIRDIKNCLMINPLEPIIPFGYLKTSLIDAREKEQVHIFNWSTDTKEFSPIEIDSNYYPVSKTWSRTNVDSLCPNLEKEEETVLIPDNKEFDLDLGSIPCLNLDILRVTIQGIKTKDNNAQIVLHYTNSLNPQKSNQKSILRKLNPNAFSQTVNFPLCARPDWVLGGNTKLISLKVSGIKRAQLNALEIVPKKDVMPFVYFKNSGYLGTKGYLHLSQKEKSKEIFINGTNLPFTKKTMIVISNPNKYFQDQNADHPEQIVLHRIFCPASGKLVIERKMFPSVGIYELRPWVLDSSNNVGGMAGDHIVISVDS